MRAFLLALAATALAGSALAEGEAGKKELVARILKIQQPGIDGVANSLVQEPAQQLWQQAAMAAQTRVAPTRREALAKAIQADIKKYVDAAAPPVRERAVRLAPATIGALLEEKFSEEELKQLLGILESPVNRRFQQLVPDMQRGLAEKLVNESRSEVQPRLQALQKSVSEKVEAAIKASAGDAAKPAPSAPAK